MAKKTTVKSGSKKKTAAKKKTAITKKNAARATAKSKKTAATKSGSGKKVKKDTGKKLSAKDLIMKKFDAWKPKELFIPASVPAHGKNYRATPFGKDISKDILLRKFDFDFADVACAPPPPREELIRKQFAPWKPGTLFVPPADTAREKAFAAPAFGDGTDKGILLRKFDFDFAEEAAKAETKRKAAEEAARIEAEKKAAEEAAKAKAEAERKEAERKAAEEAARIEAEKKAAEEAAKAKAEAERKEAERKAAEEAARIEAEKKAAEEAAKAKAEAERKEAERIAAKPEDPLIRMIKFAAAAVIVLFSLIIAASYSNSSKYYLESSDIGIQIWKGRFAPMGQELLVTLKGREAPETIKDAYSREEISAMAFAYFMEESNALMKEISYPPLDNVKTMLDQALTFAVSNDQQDAVKTQLNALQLTELLYRSDMAASRGSLEESLVFLNKAAQMKLDAGQTGLIAAKQESIRKLIADGKNTAETKDD
ncbi:MAG: hypothetical protein V2I97_12725 [Desulfococcaceae bacterium]|jgi:hypothetical protein|nr:hypothetical protein [Desulfococcaceae bacterium]